MNNDLFQQARSAYVDKDYETALADFTDCLQDASAALAPGELGLLYHQIGNCLVKLHDPNEAIHAYSQALHDTAYDAHGSVAYNLGTVYASQLDYEDAIPFFNEALEDPKYKTGYKAYMGLGNAYLKLGKSAEAGASFRSAALDEVNPDPTKALLNLGVCFMALNRPMDAIASYESALQFDMPAVIRNKLFANMGQAYVAAGKMAKAVKAFESALADQTYVFNDAANVDYQRAIQAVASGVTEEDQKNETETDLSGLDVSSTGISFEEEDAESVAEAGTMILSSADISEQMDAYGNPVQTDFFETNDVLLQDWSKSASRKKRRKGLTIAIVIIVIVLAIVGGAVAVVTQGIGLPSKQDVVAELFTDPESADLYAGDVDEAKQMRIADLIATGSSVEVVGESNDFTTAKVYVNATTPEGGTVPYEISMVRDGMGWKVTSATLYFTSQH
ncbi:tetratricopeptide repeat protein [Anaerotardibacter muris]|uniref:tetratricopeptide repeat protein n=1 Tax=Anaerotardibacter muris TaxID=2941505 RepID=UPI00203D500C|nr:tetratricopeptide repeat protein [Anaerotardibacter muris]